MGQIFNRIKRITQSYLHDKTEAHAGSASLENEDEELKRIFEELSNEAESSHKQKERNTGHGDKLSPDQAFSILGVKMDSTNQEIKAAYKKKVMEYHPDRVQTLGEEIKELAARKIKQVNEAYKMIKEQRGF